jgi:hypothetical protein
LNEGYRKVKNGKRINKVGSMRNKERINREAKKKENRNVTLYPKKKVLFFEGYSEEKNFVFSHQNLDQDP